MEQNKEYKTISGFWRAYNSSRCKTVMMIISIIITLSFALDQIFGNQNSDLAKGFFAVIGYWVGRSSKSKENGK